MQLLDIVEQLHVQQPSTYAKPEAACAVVALDVGQYVARNMLSFV